LKQLLKNRFAAGIALTIPAGTASAALLSPAHTWTGSETLTGSKRLFRNAVASSHLGAPKAFPGDLSNANTRFMVWDFTALPGSVILVTPIAQTTLSFMTLYDGTFDPANLATGYLGDQGRSDVTYIFSTLAPTGGNVQFVAISVTGASIGHSCSADVEYTPARGGAVPEPFTLALSGTALAGLLWAMRRK
jgi:hypothetical protein